MFSINPIPVKSFSVKSLAPQWISKMLGVGRMSRLFVYQWIQVFELQPWVTNPMNCDSSPKFFLPVRFASQMAQCTIELPTIHKVFWPAKTCSLLAFNLNWKNTHDRICMMLSVLQNFAKERLPVFQIRKTSTTSATYRFCLMPSINVCYNKM